GVGGHPGPDAAARLLTRSELHRRRRSLERTQLVVHGPARRDEHGQTRERGAQTHTHTPASGHEDFLAHAVARYGGRVGKLKSYVSTTAGVGTRYVGVIYDKRFATTTREGPRSD